MGYTLRTEKSPEENQRAVLWLNVKDICGFKNRIKYVKWIFKSGAALLYHSLVTSLKRFHYEY